MNKVHQINFRGVTEKYGGAAALIKEPGDCAIVTRGVARTLVMMCPDGCGETISVNLDRRIGKAWRKFEHNTLLTIYPSVWRDTGCRAHFIVWNGRILWCDVADGVRISLDEKFIESVFNRLSNSGYVHFENLANSIHAIPWDILWACNELVERRIALVSDRVNFRRIGNQFATKSSCGHFDLSV